MVLVYDNTVHRYSIIFKTECQMLKAAIVEVSSRALSVESLL